MLSEKKAKGLKGDLGSNKDHPHKPKTHNLRKHDKLLKVVTSSRSLGTSSNSIPKHSKLKGDNGKILSKSEKSLIDLAASRNSKMSTNSGVLDKLTKIEKARKEILTNFDASQREGSGSSGDGEETAQKTTNLSNKENVPPEVYEKHRKLYEELSQFFPNGNHHPMGIDVTSIRPKRHRIEEFDDGNYEIYPVEQNDDENDEENDEELENTEDGFARDFALVENDDDDFVPIPRSRRDIDVSTGHEMKRKLSPDPSKKYDEYAMQTASSKPIEVLYDGKRPGSYYQEPTSNNLQKLSSDEELEDEASLSDPVYERQKEAYLKTELGSGMTTIEQPQKLGSRSDESSAIVSPSHNLQIQENKTNKFSSTMAQKSESSPHVDTAKINMKGPKIGTDPGLPANLQAEKYAEEGHDHQQRQMHKKKKGKKRYRKQGKDIEGINDKSNWKGNGRKAVKQISHLGSKSTQDQKIMHKAQKHRKNSKGTKVQTGEFSEQLGKAGKAKSRRKRIKLVMEKRKRKAERSLDGEAWDSKQVKVLVCRKTTGKVWRPETSDIKIFLQTLLKSKGLTNPTFTF